MHWELRPLAVEQHDASATRASSSSSSVVAVTVASGSHAVNSAATASSSSFKTRSFSLTTPENLRVSLRQQPFEVFCHKTLPGFLERLLKWVGPNASRRQQIPSFLDSLLLAHVPLAGATHGATTCQEFLTATTMNHESNACCQGVCGYLFEQNDIAFNCRTCQADDTCVQCVKCFENSNHDGHEVYFHRTIPGGMCDCGDPEAWRPEGFCVQHRGFADEQQQTQQLQKQQQQEALKESTTQPQENASLLPQEMLVVARVVFHDIVRLCVDLAKKSMNAFDPERAAMDAQNLVYRLQLEDQVPTQFHVRIHNDDVHSDEELISSLTKKRVSDCKRLVKEVDTNGSAIVFTTLNPHDALTLLNGLQNEAWHACVVSDLHIQQENSLIEVIRWLKTVFSGFSTGLHVVFCEELFSLQNESCAPKEPIHVMFLADPYFRKEVVLELYQLYLKLQGDRELKLRFSLVFMNVYSRLMGRFFCGIGTSRESLFHYGVQIFTTPSIVKQLAQLGLLETLLGALCEAVDMAKTSCVKFLSQSVGATGLVTQLSLAVKSNYQVIDPNHSLIKFARYHFVVSNLAYVLNIPEMAQQAVLLHTENLCKWFCCLLQLEGLHVQLRIQDGQEHIAYEQQTFGSAFNLRVNITRLSVAIAKGLRKIVDTSAKPSVSGVLESDGAGATNEEYGASLNNEDQEDESHAISRMVWNFMNHFWHHLKLFCESVSMEFHVPPQSFLFSRPPMAVVRYDISTQPVSFHYPLHEQLGLFLMELVYSQHKCFENLTSWKSFYDESMKSYDNQDATDLIWGVFEYPLRALTFSSQIQSGFWVRNGNNMKRQMELYLISHREGHDFRDVDAFLIQFSGMVLGMDTFLCAFFDRCGLLPWLFGPRAENVPGLASDKRILMLEESLLKLISLVTDLPMHADALTNGEALLRREIVHRLAYRPSSRSELVDLVEYVLLTPAGRMTPTSITGAESMDSFERLHRVLDQVATVVSKKTGSFGASGASASTPGSSASGNSTTTFAAGNDGGELKDTIHAGNNSECQELSNDREPDLAVREGSFNRHRGNSIGTFANEDDAELEPNKYEITKDAFANEYDPCFCHLSRPEHEKAQIRRQEILFRSWKLEDPPIPLVARLPHAHDAFAKFRLSLVEKGLLAIVRVLLEDATLRHPKKTSVLVVMRVLHLLNLVVLVLRDEKHLMTSRQHKQVLNMLRSGREMFEEISLRRDKKRQKQRHDEKSNGAGGDYGSSSDQGSDCNEVCEQSIVELLVVLVKEQSKNDLQSLKPSISVIYWILNELSKMDEVVMNYAKKELWHPQSEQTDSENGMTLAERRKLHQQRAIQLILARQKAFAENHLASLELEEEDDADNEPSEIEGAVKPVPAPECFICSHVDDTDPVMYIGHVQTSQVTSHALCGKPCSSFENGFARPQMFLQLCGHAVHLNCWRTYMDSINESTRLGGEQSHMSIAFNAQLGEFLCPLCQTLSSTLVPYVEPRRVACAQQRESEKEAMERVFRTKQDSSVIAHWLSMGLVERLRSPRLPDGVQVEAQRGAMSQFGRTYKAALDRFKSADQVSVPIVLMTSAYQAHLIWSSISSTFYSKQLHGVSLAVCDLEMSCSDGNSARNGKPNGNGPPLPLWRSTAGNTAGKSSSASLRLATILNPPSPSLERRLALNLPEQFEQQLEDCFSSKDDFKMNCVLRALRLVPLLFDSNNSFLAAVRDPLVENLQFQLTKATWIKAVENDAPLVLGLPVLSQDLMHLLLVVCSMLETKAEMVLTMRCFCVLHIAQVLLLCSQLDAEEDDFESVEHTDDGVCGDETERSLEHLMSILSETGGLQGTSSQPKGKQLRCLFETSSLSFLRQVTLFCRAVFRGGENDPEASLYANFVNNLHLSSTFERMRKQLGLPTVLQILQTPELLEYLKQAALQLRTNAFGFVHARVKSNYFAGFAQPLLQALEQDYRGDHLEFLKSNLAWMPRLPIRQESEHDGQAGGGGPVKFYFASARLVKLPRLYTDLYVKYIGRKCPTAAGTGSSSASGSNTQENPAICLLCDQVVCGGTDCCRKQGIGACTLHARTCGDGMGVFFLLRDCSILLVFGSRSCHFKTPPYVDMFGEEDLHLRRGRPLFLHNKRVKALLNLVASHQVATEVARMRRSSERYIRNSYY